jgi:hypothetical protein
MQQDTCHKIPGPTRLAGQSPQLACSDSWLPSVGVVALGGIAYLEALLDCARHSKQWAVLRSQTRSDLRGKATVCVGPSAV